MRAPIKVEWLGRELQPVATARGSVPFRVARDGRTARLVRRFAVDRAPLRASRDFRLIWWGEVVSQTGTQIATVALLIQVYDLTHSSAAVGVVGLVQLIPMIVVSMLMGPVIDRVDRRKILVVAGAAGAGPWGLLLWGALRGPPPLALVYGAAA